MILDANEAGAIARAARALQAGDLVGMPTETVYGLAADATREAAVAKIFAAKGRPSAHPLIVHVADASGVQAFAADVPAFAQSLIQAFWPGPLTLILSRRKGVAAAASGQQDSIGLRCPSHPVAQALLKECRVLGVPGLAAPSANRFGRVSPTTAAHVAAEFDPDLLILDGGACAVGIESTIIDCTRGAPVLLRPGAITVAQVQNACGQAVLTQQALDSPAPRASGTLQSHYAPNARVRLMDAPTLQSELDIAKSEVQLGASKLAIYARSDLPLGTNKLIFRLMPSHAEAAARELFAVLRELDNLGVEQIWVETPPDTPAWAGVSDRLGRAAA
jgi:L-threonylcarbamoyladenylate synthase